MGDLMGSHLELHLKSKTMRVEAIHGGWVVLGPTRARFGPIFFVLYLARPSVFVSCHASPFVNFARPGSGPGMVRIVSCLFVLVPCLYSCLMKRTKTKERMKKKVKIGWRKIVLTDNV
ncbi:unnamed protein product [Linum trigynum]|uniref:Transmembrane protein n=1 Tax=Linum trigynum TaxID=586398 RepID=A0AAV2GT40_9ROSI